LIKLTLFVKLNENKFKSGLFKKFKFISEGVNEKFEILLKFLILLFKIKLKSKSVIYNLEVFLGNL